MSGENGEPEQKITTVAAANLAGVKPSTWRAWRCQGRPRPEPVPDPDGWFELRTPWWWESTVVEWVKRRRQHQEQELDPEEQK